MLLSAFKSAKSSVTYIQYIHAPSNLVIVLTPVRPIFCKLSVKGYESVLWHSTCSRKPAPIEYAAFLRLVRPIYLFIQAQISQNLEVI